MSNSTGQSANGFHLLRLGECSLRCPKRLGAFRHARFQGLIELAERFRASRALGHVIAYLPLPPAARQGSIYENQASATKTYFKKTAA